MSIIKIVSNTVINGNLTIIGNVITINNNINFFENIKGTSIENYINSDLKLKCDLYLPKNISIYPESKEYINKNNSTLQTDILKVNGKFMSNSWKYYT